LDLVLEETSLLFLFVLFVVSMGSGKNSLRGETSSAGAEFSFFELLDVASTGSGANLRGAFLTVVSTGSTLKLRG
jgi:hypothetical protein